MEYTKRESYPNGYVKYECYYKNYKLHRDNDLPAVIMYYPNGRKSHEIYYKHGKLHRNDKFAYYFYSESYYNGNGKIYCEKYLNGIKYN